MPSQILSPRMPHQQPEKWDGMRAAMSFSSKHRLALPQPPSQAEEHCVSDVYQISYGGGWGAERGGCETN